ncbi:MAG: DNA repair protein RecO [Halanaerobiales bacterium]|nr:DNA repair protein RecO [Halanaerobiales bacterium]
MSLIKTESIVLKQFDLGETDKIITFFTKEHGKIRAVAKKARSSKNNKISASVLPFCYNHITVYKTKSLDRLNNIESIYRFENLRNNLEKMAYSSYFAEMVEKAGMEYHPNPDLFSLLLNTFYKIERSKQGELEKINIVFRLLFLLYLGLKPTINYCYECGKKYKTLDIQYFDVKEGGLICSKCVQTKNYKIDKLLQNEMDLIKRIYRMRLKALDEIEIKSELIKKLDKLIDDFSVYHLDFELKSKEFLQIILGFDKN